MEEAEYGFSHHGAPVHLTLTPAAAAEHQWCPGTYIGGIYAVPGKPRCGRGTPCSRARTRPLARKLLVRIAPGMASEREPYSYPGELPRPTDHSIRMVKSFEVQFLTSRPPPGQRRVHRIDGPICPAWGISLPCDCPTTEHPQLTNPHPDRNLPAGYGWVEITLSYPLSGLPALASCPGGIAIDNQAGLRVASTGYPEGPFGGGPGIASGSTTTIVLAPGAWHAVASAGRGSSASAAFTVVVGQGTSVSIQLS